MRMTATSFCRERRSSRHCSSSLPIAPTRLGWKSSYVPGDIGLGVAEPDRHQIQQARRQVPEETADVDAEPEPSRECEPGEQ